MGIAELSKKYSVAGPRYTSYPTAPQWIERLGASEYEEALAETTPDAGQALSMYLHIPFCEALCYYCGCNIQITHDHNKGAGYVDNLVREIASVATRLKGRPRLQQISFGGGTPTFLSSTELERLFRGITDCFEISPEAEISIEVDPRVTTDEHLRTLQRLGFNRISLGVQDFDPLVQKAVNRLQSAELTSRMLGLCRELGFRGINFDLMYGLPLQTVSSFEKTLDQVLAMGPDRVALYNYAHLPSLRPHQKILEKHAMASPEERTDIFNLGYERLTAGGYASVGMDHFAKKDDELYLALERGTLYRNFMGYTVRRAPQMIGIGASAIGELSSGYFQNIRETKPYEAQIGARGVATFRGCRFTPDDLRRKWVIQTLMCNFVLRFEEFENRFQASFLETFAEEVRSLPSFQADGLLQQRADSLVITSLGRIFIRNIAMVFDAYLRSPKGATYSKTV